MESMQEQKVVTVLDRLCLRRSKFIYNGAGGEYRNHSLEYSKVGLLEISLNGY